MALFATSLAWQAWTKREQYRVQVPHAFNIGVAFYEGVQAIEGIREPSISARELIDAEKALGDRPAATRDDEWDRLKHAKVLVSRVEAHSSLWEEIAGLKATAKLLFHEQINGALDDLLLARRTLLAAATMHARTNNDALRERARLIMLTQPRNPGRSFGESVRLCSEPIPWTTTG